jgi:FixJ family two-component response regulator
MIPPAVEREALEAIAAGHQVADIAERLGISIRTVYRLRERESVKPRPRGPGAKTLRRERPSFTLYRRDMT